ncbi:hypothetical protein ABFX02_07G044800 [Erythranthe guttata]
MNHHHVHVESFDENCWCDLLDYSSLLDDVVPPPDLNRNPPPPPQHTQNVGTAIDVSISETSSHVSECAEREFRRKRGRSDPDGGIGTKACRERMRREKLNDRFSELCAVLQPGKPVKTDKLAILADAIRALNQLKADTQEYTEMNERLLEEIKSLKAEKNELREEKLTLKADKKKIEQQLKTTSVSPIGFMPAHPPLYQAEINKVPMFPNYGFVPMWHYLPQSTRDTSQDHELRPPAA